jgi:hypothetical protein
VDCAGAPRPPSSFGPTGRARAVNGQDGLRVAIGQPAATEVRRNGRRQRAAIPPGWLCTSAPYAAGEGPAGVEATFEFRTACNATAMRMMTAVLRNQKAGTDYA